MDYYRSGMDRVLGMAMRSSMPTPSSGDVSRFRQRERMLRNQILPVNPRYLMERGAEQAPGNVRDRASMLRDWY